MLPEIDEDFMDDDIDADLEELNEESNQEPSYTYAMNNDTSKIVGKCDDIEAVKQAVYKMLNTERYESPIYSWDYGVELKELFGKPRYYCCAEIERQFTEALLIDDRITDVSNFAFSFPKRGEIAVSFNVTTTYGDIDIEREVEY